MNEKTGLTSIAVRTWRPAKEYHSNQIVLNALNVPPRSRLYGLVPCGVNTTWTESLTSYINRLGWAHRVSPGELVAEELIPHLGSDHPLYQLTAFC